MRATRTLHELRRDKECLFACKSYDMKDCIAVVLERRVPINSSITGRNNILSGDALTVISLVGKVNCFNCDLYKLKLY